MKQISFILAFGFSLFFSSCDKCKGEDPRARIINNSSVNSSVQVKTSGGSTVNIKSDANTSSSFSSFASGNTTFTIVVDKKDYVTTVDMQDCYEYDINIDSNNNITSTPTNRN